MRRIYILPIYLTYAFLFSTPYSRGGPVRRGNTLNCDRLRLQHSFIEFCLLKL